MAYSKPVEDILYPLFYESGVMLSILYYFLAFFQLFKGCHHYVYFLLLMSSKHIFNIKHFAVSVRFLFLINISVSKLSYHFEFFILVHSFQLHTAK